MARRKALSPAEKAASDIEAIKGQVSGMVSGWRSRNVTQAVWHEAHDILAKLYDLSPAQWEGTEIKLCEQYEAWKAWKGAAA